MKVLFFSLLIPFAFLLNSENMNLDLNDTTTISQAENEVGVEVEVEIDFGRKKKDCGGFGVCKITGGAGIDIGGVLDGFKSFGVVTYEGSRASGITFFKSSMNAATIKKYFSGNNFIVKENFRTKISDKKNTYEFILKAGKYKINETGKGFNIGMPPN